jgi:hypothetical protein
MDRASRYVIARKDNVVHVDFDRGSRPPRPTFPGAAALRFKSSSSAYVSVNSPPLLRQAVMREPVQV